MSTILSAREREVQNLLRQKEAELKQANAELEERGKLLYKTKVAIEQLQSELTASRKEEAVIREEAQRICDEQAAELRRAEDQLTAVESALQQRNSQAQQLQARLGELEAELESSRHEQRTFGSAIAAKERDHVRRIESLQDEVEHQQEQVVALENLLRERTSQLSEQKEKLSTISSDKEEADRLAYECAARAQNLSEDKKKLEQQLQQSQTHLEDVQKQLAAAATLAETRLKDKAAADKEWADRMVAADQQATEKLKAVEAKIKELEERGVVLSKALADAEGELSQHHLTRQRQVEAAQELCGREMAEAEAVWEKRLAACQRAADEALVDAQRAWERRLRECEQGWQSKLQEVQSTWALKFSREQQQWEHARSDWEHWHGRVQDEIEAAQTDAAREAKRAAAAQIQELEAKAAADKVTLERTYKLQLEEAERAWSERLSAALSAANSRCNELKQQHSLQEAKVAEGAALNVAEAEARWRKQLDELKRRWAAEQVACDRAWAAKLEEQHNKWLKEKHDLESATGARLEAAQMQAAAEARALRAKLEGRINTIAARLGQLANQEEARERRRQELAAQVEELRTAGADEFNRRLSLEATLRQAAALFKRELAHKSDEVSGLQSQLRAMRHEIAASNACSASAIAATGATWHAAAAGGSCVGSPAATTGAYGSFNGGFKGCDTSPPAAGQQAAAQASCSPAAAVGASGVSGAAAAAAPSPGGGVTDSAAAAAAAVAAELQSLRASRAGYQNALLQQQAMRNSLLSSLGTCLEECNAARSSSPVRSPHRQRCPPASVDHAIMRQHHWCSTPPPAAIGNIHEGVTAYAAGNRSRKAAARKCLFSSPQPQPTAKHVKQPYGSLAGSRGLHDTSWLQGVGAVGHAAGCAAASQHHSSMGQGATSHCKSGSGGRIGTAVAAGGLHGDASDVYASQPDVGVGEDSSITSEASQYEAWQQELSFRLGSALRKLEQPVL